MHHVSTKPKETKWKEKEGKGSQISSSGFEPMENLFKRIPHNWYDSKNVDPFDSVCLVLHCVCAVVFLFILHKSISFTNSPIYTCTRAKTHTHEEGKKVSEWNHRTDTFFHSYTCCELLTSFYYHIHSPIYLPLNISLGEAKHVLFIAFSSLIFFCGSVAAWVILKKQFRILLSSIFFGNSRIRMTRTKKWHI